MGAAGMEAGEMAKVKGVALMSRVNLLKKAFGEPAWSKVLEQLTPESREIIDRGLLASSWYPEELYRDMNVAIEKALEPGIPNINLKLGELSAEEVLTGIYSSKVKDGVEQTIARGPMLWSTFHDTGEVGIEKISENTIRIRITGYAMPHRQHCKGLGSWFQTMVALSGGKNASNRELKCVSKGDSICEWELRWD
jgi:hypothetical protein